MTLPTAPATWFVSDPHLGDEAIIPVCRRQFSSVQEMDDLLIRQWRRHVHPDDDVFVLGDVTGSSLPSRERGLAQIAQLPGRKILVPGNHDATHGHDPDSLAWTTAAAIYLAAGFAEIRPGPVSVRAEDWTRDWEFPIPDVTLSHFPAQPAYFEAPDRYPTYRPADTGTIVVHGHAHDAWRVLMTPAGTIQINVSPEVSSYAPTSLDDVLSLVSLMVRARPDWLDAHLCTVGERVTAAGQEGGH